MLWRNSRERDQFLLSVVKEGASEFIFMLNLYKNIGKGTAAGCFLLGAYQCRVPVLPFLCPHRNPVMFVFISKKLSQKYKKES